MGLWEASGAVLRSVVDRLSDISEKKAVNLVRLRKSNLFIYLRGNKDGSVDVTPTIRLKNVPAERAERFIRALDELVTSHEIGSFQDTR